MNLFAVAEAIATAVAHKSVLLRYEADAAIAGMHLPRVPHPDEPLVIGWCGVMFCGTKDFEGVTIE